MSELTDRELDVLVAGAIFGIKKIFKPADYQSGRDALYGGDEPSWISSGKPPRTHMIDARPIPTFSSDISAAMEVVEKMRVNHGVIINTHKKAAWHVCFGATNHPGEATNESLPRAICEAALKAIASEPASQ